MARYFTYIAVIAVVFLCVPFTPARAAVVSRDWRELGDGLLTYDDVNNREWLDLSESLLSHFYQPGVSILDTALAELEPGGLFDEFTWATGDDVTALARSAGIDTTTTDFGVNGEAMIELVDLLSPTDVTFSNEVSLGFIDDFLEPPHNSIQALAYFSVRAPGQPTFPGRASLFFRNTGGTGPGQIGLMLYRNSIPEPTSLKLLLLLLLISLVFKSVHCFKQNHLRV